MSNHSLAKKSTAWYRELQQGMTMVEMLVVIAILGVLMAALFGVIQPMQQIERGRDGRRISDVKAMQSAFEQYYTLNGYKYDVSVGATGACSNMAGTLSGSRLPVDPAGANYNCTGTPANSATATDYCVCAQLLNQQMQTKFANSQNNVCNFQPQAVAANGTPTNTFYCMKNQQ